MVLGDVERLISMPAGTLEALRARLRASGFGEAFVARLGRIGERLDDPLRAPLRAWHARRMREDAAIVARLFVVHDPVPRDDVRRVLGEPAPLVDAGLLADTGDGALASPFHLAPFGDLFVFGDAGTAAEATPPLNGVTRALASAVLPPAAGTARGPALDLGCGAGALALALARASDGAERVAIATDVSARAVLLTRFNARLNGVANVEVRQGDLYDPVAGESFALIVSQPPFVARRAGVGASPFAHGGERGDELALRVLAGAARHLSPGGRAVVLADWPLFEPLVDGASLDERIREATGVAGAPVNVLVLQSPNKNLDEHCAHQAAAEHPHLDADFARAACAQRDHLERLGMRAIAQAFVVLGTSAGKPRTGLLQVRHGSDAPITAAAIDRILTAHAASLGSALALHAARLRLAPGARFLEQPTPTGIPPVVIVQSPADRPEWPTVVDPKAARVLQTIDRTGGVVAAATAWAAEATIPVERALALVEIVARDALLRGALELVP